MLIQNIFNRKMPLHEKSLIFFVFSSYLQVFIYSINLLAPDFDTSLFNVFRLFLVCILIADSLNLHRRFRAGPLIVILLLLISATYIIPFAFFSPSRLVSGLISFAPLLLLVSTIAQASVCDSINTTILKRIELHVRFLLSLALFFCLVNEYLWRSGYMLSKFGGALSFYGMLPRNTSFFAIPGTSGAFVFSCLVLLCYFKTLTPGSRPIHLGIFFFIGFIIILSGAAGAAFVALILFILFCYPWFFSKCSNRPVSFSLLSALSRLSLLFVPISIMSLILRREDVLTSVSGRFAIFDYFSSRLGGIALLPNPDFFGLATNYAQSAFGSLSFVQTPDSLIVSILVQYGVILTGVVFLCLTIPFLKLGLNCFSSFSRHKLPKLSVNSLIGFGMLLGSLAFALTSNILESYPFIFFLSFLYSSPLLFTTRVQSFIS